MYTVYVLQSTTNRKRYIGFTSKNLKRRLAWHKWGLASWTRQNGPMELILFEEYENKRELYDEKNF